jgi:hypothetical protein
MRFNLPFFAMNVNRDLADVLARTRALVAEARQVRRANQDLYQQSRQAVVDALTQLQAQKELLQGITPRRR